MKYLVKFSLEISIKVGYFYTYILTNLLLSWSQLQNPGAILSLFKINEIETAKKINLLLY